MNKLVTLVMSMMLLACVSNPGVRPDTDRRAEDQLRSGLSAYKNDDFQAAVQKFNRALQLYQSLDDIRGAQLARINLLEALLALSDHVAAEEQLAILKQQAGNNFLDERLQHRVVLLQVKLLYQQQRYSDALAAVEPLLLQTDKKALNDSERLELLATAARLETSISKGINVHWLNQFRAALKQEPEPRQPKFQVLLKRIEASIAVNNRQYPEALKLLDETLTYYKAQAERRAIASCLEEIADVKLAQHQNPQALEHLERALAIRLWLKDRNNVEKIRQKIALIHQQP